MANITLIESELLILVSEEGINIAVIENCNDTEKIKQALIDFYTADDVRFELPTFDSSYSNESKMFCTVINEEDEEGSIYTITLKAIIKY